MRLLVWLAFFSFISSAATVSAQELAFGSETWRGHAFQLKDVPLSCRVFSYFGNGDRIGFVAVVAKGSSQVTFLAFLSPSSIDTGGPAAPNSIGPLIDKLARLSGTALQARSWVDDHADAAVQGTINGRAVTFAVGTLDTDHAAKYFNSVRDGSSLHIAIGGQDRKYVLRGSFAALSELVGCALKARDGEVMPSSGLPSSPASEPPVAAQTPLPTAPASSPPVQQVTSAVPQPQTRPVGRKLSSSGSGIVVTADGHILTNDHVVKGCSSFGLRAVGDGERPATLLAHDSQNDLALLKAAKPYDQAAVLRIEPPRLAETVLVFGFPLSAILASSGNVTLGNVSALTGLRDDSRDIQITAAVQPGNSGGPVFDGSGLLLGVIQSKLDTIRAASITGDIAQNVNFAIRSSLAVSFLGANGIEPAFEKRRPALPADEIADHAQKVTVQVLCYGGDE
jgi:S1-C subfamily serine protease